MKNFTQLIILLMAGMSIQATTHMVTVSNFQFSPTNIPNVVVGDIIQFNFGGPNIHNVTSTPLGAVPTGASNIYSGTTGSVTTSYQYTVTTAGNYRYYCQNHSVDGINGMVGTFSASGTVPVRLNYFEAAYSDNTVTANWRTNAEENTAYFSLEKSVDGKKYEEVGRVFATGIAGAGQTYQYIDKNISKDVKYIYYMLRSVDLDGNYSLSAVKMVRNTQSISKLITQISPNPVSREVGHLVLQFNSDRTTTMKALVSDANGKTVMNLSMAATRGINNGHIHMGSLPAGLYSIFFSLDGLKETRKIMVK